MDKFCVQKHNFSFFSPSAQLKDIVKKLKDVGFVRDSIQPDSQPACSEHVAVAVGLLRTEATVNRSHPNEQVGLVDKDISQRRTKKTSLNSVKEDLGIISLSAKKNAKKKRSKQRRLPLSLREAGNMSELTSTCSSQTSSCDGKAYWYKSPEGVLNIDPQMRFA